MPQLGEIQEFAVDLASVHGNQEVRELRAAGWLACEGQILSKQGPFEKLWRAVSERWESAGESHFRVPDLRKRRQQRSTSSKSDLNEHQEKRHTSSHSSSTNQETPISGSKEQASSATSFYCVYTGVENPPRDVQFFAERPV